MAAESGVELLGALPLEARVREEADGGAPSVVSAPGTPRATAFVEMARHTAGALARRGRDRRGQFPQIVVEES
jgi:ATP-binding protein involved in chromosome partitioning